MGIGTRDGFRMWSMIFTLLVRVNNKMAVFDPMHPVEHIKTVHNFSLFKTSGFAHRFGSRFGKSVKRAPRNMPLIGQNHFVSGKPVGFHGG